MVKKYTGLSVFQRILLFEPIQASQIPVSAISRRQNNTGILTIFFQYHQAQAKLLFVDIFQHFPKNPLFSVFLSCFRGTLF